MPMYHLLEYSDDYFMTSGSLWNYYRDESHNDANENAANADNYKININKTTTSRSFEYKTKITGKTPAGRLDTEVVVPLKYLSTFWRSLDLPSINFEIGLDFSRSKNCVISEVSRAAAVAANPNANPPVPAAASTTTTSATFQIMLNCMSQLSLCL